MPLLKPLDAKTHPDLADVFAWMEKAIGVIPNSLLTMQRKPELVRAFSALAAAVTFDGEVPADFKVLIGHFCSRAAGCRYCQAHTLASSEALGMSQEKLQQLWSYETSPLYSPAERAALDLALASGAVPNAVDDELMQRMRAHWSENQIVEIVAMIALFGFLNRWNDTMATTLEDLPNERAAAHFAQSNTTWDAGKHKSV